MKLMVPETKRTLDKMTRCACPLNLLETLVSLVGIGYLRLAACGFDPRLVDMPVGHGMHALHGQALPGEISFGGGEWLFSPAEQRSKRP